MGHVAKAGPLWHSEKAGPRKYSPLRRREMLSSREVAGEGPAPHPRSCRSEAGIAVFQQIELISCLSALRDLLQGAVTFGDLPELGPRAHGVAFVLGRPSSGAREEQDLPNSESSAKSAAPALASWKAPQPLRAKMDGFPRQLKSSTSPDASGDRTPRCKTRNVAGRLPAPASRLAQIRSSPANNSLSAEKRLPRDSSEARPPGQRPR